MNELVIKYGNLCGLCGSFEFDVLECGNNDISVLQIYIEALINTCGVDEHKIKKIQKRYKEESEQAHYIFELMEEYKLSYYNKICDIESNLANFNEIQKIENIICQSLSLNREQILYGYILVATTNNSKIYYHAHEDLKIVDKPFMIQKNDGTILFANRISTCHGIDNDDIHWNKNNLNKIIKLGGE